MQTEKEKMLAGELYLASDPELFAERAIKRERNQRFNDSVPHSDSWRAALSALLPNAQSDSYIEPPFFCDYGYNIHVGANFYANFNCVILDVNRVEIGDNVMFGPSVQVYTASHPLDVERRVDQALELGLPITIGDNVWIGGGSVICPNVTIGDNSVIGAGSVVVKDIPANVVAAGNPCRVIKSIDNEPKL